MRPVGKIGVYGEKTRNLQRRLSFEAFGLTFKVAKIFKYLGSRTNATPDIDDIQITTFMETPDRAYAQTPIDVPIGMERFTEGKMDFSQYGVIMPMTEEHQFRMHIDDFAPLGRDLIIGDVFELPFYNNDTKGRSLWEVTDVDLKQAEERFIAIIYAVPLSKSRETREIDTDRDNSSGLADLIAQANQEAAQELPAENPTYDIPVVPDDPDFRDDDQADVWDNDQFTF